MIDSNLREKLRKIPELVWSELLDEEEGKSIIELQTIFGREFIVDREQKSNRKEKVWYKKEIITKNLKQKLDIQENDFSKDKVGNDTFSKTIANSITDLRESGKIIDVKYGFPRYGIWRKTSPEEETAIMEFKNGNYSWPETDSTSQEIKKREFTNYILKIYERKCCICQFKDQKNLSAVTIVPLEIMKDFEPKNSLSPSNGLLLCRICENEFKKGVIEISENGEIIKTEKFHKLDDYHLEYWIEKINGILKISFPKGNTPGKKFLNLRRKLK
jgi:hypothetical protein